MADAAVEAIRELPGDPWKLAEPPPKNWGMGDDLGPSTPPNRQNPSTG